MKASRRQQLRTNELAQNLTQLVEFLKANTGSVLAGAAAVVVLVALGIYWYSANVSRKQQGWTQYYATQMSRTPEERLAALQQLASDYKDPVLASMALLSLGDGSLQQAKAPMRGPEDRQRLASQAIGAFNEIINNYPEQTLAVAGARFKLAGLAEDGHDWQEARRQYQAIISDKRFERLPQRQEAVEAEKRLEDLSQNVVFAPATTTGPTSRKVATPPTAKAVSIKPTSKPSKTASRPAK
ncbi:MAG: hypothetical protein JXQ73_23880 [Phycisphaerae bacterium]|nr:hypothetical protein [Phycisphaerae bacterium]